MTKKLLTILTLCILCVCCAFGFTACNKAKDGKNSKDIQMSNIYNIYVAYAEENGVTPKTYEEWLSLIKGERGEKGEDGIDGKDGKSAYEIWLANGYSGTQSDFLNWLKGENGINGTDGVDGEDGKDGTNGIDGKDGIGVKTAVIDDNGDLIITLTDGSILNAGKVINNDNPQGLDFYLLPDGTYGVGGGNAYFLDEIIIPSVYCGKAVTQIICCYDVGYNGFNWFNNLTRISIPDTITSIGEYAFQSCSSLTSITFNGTKAQWNAINKGKDWNNNVPATLVRCIDGKIEIEKETVVIDESKPFIGLITLHGEDSTYDKNFIDAFTAACEVKNVKGIIGTYVAEDSQCYDAASGLAQSGCKAVFADSFGHESYLIQAAKRFSSTKFFHATGLRAHTEGLDNYYNTFANIYEGRYLTGYAAGLKLLTMKDKAVNNNFKIGWVDAFPYAECISARTAFYLGVKAALNENDSAYTVSMDVRYVGAWYDLDGEKVAAENLIADGCVLISQYSDSMGAPMACEQCGIPNVAYNYSTGKSTMVAYCKINWQPYFEKMIDCALNGEDMPVDYCGTLNDNSVQWYLGDNVADGAVEKVKAIETELINGTRKVFDCSKFTVGGENITSYLADVDEDGAFIGDTNVIITDTDTGITYFAESYYRSAPYFDIEIDGITIRNSVWTGPY